MGTEVVAAAPARWVVRAMSQVPAVAVVAAEQANAWSPALRWLSILSAQQRARTHATHWLPALRWVVALQTVDTVNIIVPLPSTCKRHTGAGTSCGCSRTPVHPGIQRIFRNWEGTGHEEYRIHLLQAVMVQLQMRAAQDAILLRTVTAS